MARSPTSAKSDNINIRVSPETLGVIDRAAGISGKNRTDFILDVVRKAAEDALLDQRLFVMDSLEWDEFQAALDAPVRPNPKLEALLSRRPVWDR